MPIAFFPVPGMVLICDYDAGGFQPPEMVKRRPVVVVSPRIEKRHSRIALVVPLSTTPPQEPRPVHVPIVPGRYPFLNPTAMVWAKADMLSHVGFERLDRMKIDGRYADSRLTVLLAEDLLRVRRAAIHALGMGKLLVAAIPPEPA